MHFTPTTRRITKHHQVATMSVHANSLCSLTHFYKYLLHTGLYWKKNRIFCARGWGKFQQHFTYLFSIILHRIQYCALKCASNDGREEKEKFLTSCSSRKAKWNGFLCVKLVVSFLSLSCCHRIIYCIACERQIVDGRNKRWKVFKKTCFSSA